MLRLSRFGGREGREAVETASRPSRVVEGAPSDRGVTQAFDSVFAIKAARTAEVAGLLVLRQRSSRFAQPRFSKRLELVEPAAELAFPAPHDTVALARHDRAGVGLEAARGDRRLWAVEIAPGRLAVGRPQSCRLRAGRDEPATGWAEPRVRDGARLVLLDPERLLAGRDVPGDHVVVPPGAHEERAVGAERDAVHGVLVAFEHSLAFGSPEVDDVAVGPSDRAAVR